MNREEDVYLLMVSHAFVPAQLCFACISQFFEKLKIQVNLKLAQIIPLLSNHKVAHT